MCDAGMLDYKRIHEGRVLRARVAGKAVTQKVALARAAELLKSADPASSAVVLSAEHSQEDNLALLWLAQKVLGTSAIYVTGRAEGRSDKVLIHGDKNPNSSGVAELVEGIRPFSELAFTAKAGKLKTVVALGSHIPSPEQLAALAAIPNLVAFSTHEGPWAEKAGVVLPASSFVESDGTFVNAQGLSQRSEQVIQPQGDSLPAWRLVDELGKVLGRAPGWRRLEDLRKALVSERRAASHAVESAGVSG